MTTMTLKAETQRRQGQQPDDLALLLERAWHGHKLVELTESVDERLSILAAVVWPHYQHEDEAA
jgi:hypothetical protein